MILYTVKYKLKGQWFWRTLKRVKEDFLISKEETSFSPRVFIFEDESRMEITMNGSSFWFSKERTDLIRQNEKNKKKN